MEKNLENEKFKPTNREKSRQPHSHGFWCWGCDACIVFAGQKCPVCGKKNDKQREKKLAPEE